MDRDRLENHWKQLAGSVKRRWDKLVDGQLDLWAGKRDHAKPLARRQAGREKFNDSNQGDQS